MMIKVIAMVLLSSMACNNTKNINNSKNSIKSTSGNEMLVQPLNIKKKIEKTEQQLKFKIKNVVQKEDALLVDLSYSGGCVDNHEFELYSTGKPDSNGVIDLFLLHKTEDNCKMLLMRQRVFDISKINKKKSFTSFRINNGEVFKAKKAK